MQMFVGLGNPGDAYLQTRHNAGFMVVDRLSEGKRWQRSKSGLLEYVWLGGGERELIKPLTFMNRSGDAVAYAMKKHVGLSVSDLVVVHDDLDLALGEFQIVKGKGPKQHNGVHSIERALKSEDFWRVRVGISHDATRIVSTEPLVKISGKDYVLGTLTADECVILDQVIDEIIIRLDALEV